MLKPKRLPFPMPYPHMATEELPDGVALHLFDGDAWERLNFTSWDELNSWLKQNGYQAYV